MRHPRDFSFIRRLNAPTRAAAARRRRLRKGLAAGLTASAILVALPTAPHTDATSRPDDAGRLRGRHIVSLPADPGLTAALTVKSRVNVWDERGHRLVANAPVLVPDRSGAPRGPSGTDSAPVLVAVEARDLQPLSHHRRSTTGDAPNLTITLNP